MRKSTYYLLFMAFNLALVCLTAAHARLGKNQAAPALEGKAALVSQLGLTDLALFTEARYTRHPAMADLSTPFQDYPMSMEHYPTGSLVGPPPHLKQGGGQP